MSLKINVIYKDIIYSIRGIKVLCSGVIAVVLLLVAIVAMGVWMLINVYNTEELQKAIASNASYNGILNHTTNAPSIEYGRSEGIATENILLHHFKNQQMKNLSLLVLPKSNLRRDAIFNERSKVLYADDAKLYLINDKLDKRDLFTTKTPHKISATTEIAWKGRQESDKNFSPKQMFKNLNATLLRKSNEFNRNGQNYFKYDSTDNIQSQFNKEITDSLPIMPLESLMGRFLTQSATLQKNKFSYIGPPVVGYGSNPYEVLTQKRIKEYDNFWRTYTRNKFSNESNYPQNINLDKFTLDDVKRKNMKPYLRGLRPTVVEYDVSVRPDAQAPTKLNSSKILPTSFLPYQSSHPLLPQNVHNLSILDSRPQKSHGEEQTLKSRSKLTTKTNPNIPLLGSLQDLYDYSKKIAASLLNFNSKSIEKIINSSQKLGEYGINLIENHNQVFQSQINQPFKRLAGLISSAERLRSLDPFELSLITWTFLDFWEFLIEKVGALSNEDLSLLQQRLDTLRRQKDDMFTQVFVNESLSRYSFKDQKHISGNSNGILSNRTISSIENKKNENIDHDLRSNDNNNHTLLNKARIIATTPSFHAPTPAELQVQKMPSALGRTNFRNKEPIFKREGDETLNSTLQKFFLLNLGKNNEQKNTTEIKINLYNTSMPIIEGRSNWDPLELFTSEARIEFMQFAVKVLFNFGKVCLKKPYAMECLMLLFCKDLNHNTKAGGLEGMAAKLKR